MRRSALRLDGLDGSHLFGFLASFGLLRLLDLEARSRVGAQRPKLCFDQDYRAVLEGVDSINDASCSALDGLRKLRERLRSRFAPIAKPKDLRQEFVDAIFDSGDVLAMDELAGFGCYVENEAHESTLCAANGAGHQNLIASIRDVLALVERYPDTVEKALSRPWISDFEPTQQDRKALDLKNRKPTLRLDPADERLYALRADDPTSTTASYRTELGGQALASAAFGGLPLVPRAHHPVTVGSERRGARTYFCWGLWSVPTTYASARSLLACGSFQREIATRRGLFAAFRAARITGAKGKLSFAPTEPWW